MDAANAAAAAMLRAGGAASAGADAAAPPAPSDVERIAASLGFDVCSDSDDDDELMSLVPADAAAHAEWVDEDEQFDGAPRTEHEALAPPPAPALADLAIFGPVREPFYVVRLRDAADADAVAARNPAGRDVFAPADRVAFVRPEELSSRGCDASNALAKKRGATGRAPPVYEGPPPPP
ncbi:hypothetical protein JL722_3710 [Aureococcus anophagefferens]|nr:hypothetical protein JL722_3710 [Aureococcus anophagefferens]